MPKLHIDVVNKRKLWYAISAVLLLVGVVSLLFRGLNLGIDFTGGNIMQLQFSQTVTSEELRSVVSSYVEATPTIQASDNNVFLIRTEDMPEEQSNQLLTQVESELGSFEILRNERIGPVIGAELIANAWWALLLALADRKSVV